MLRDDRLHYRGRIERSNALLFHDHQKHQKMLDRRYRILEKYKTRLGCLYRALGGKIKSIINIIAAQEPRLPSG